jgi:phage gp29-like protein
VVKEQQMATNQLTTQNAPPLVWADGRPMIMDTLRREIAAPSVGSVRSIQSGHPAQGMDPYKLGQIMRAAEGGDEIAYFELAEEIEEKDLHILSILGTRKRAICALPIEVDAAGDSPEEQADAELVRDWLDTGVLQLALFDILDAIGKGRSACEIIWKTTSSLWTPEKIKWRDPRHFEYDRTTGEDLRLRTNEGPKRLPAAKFIVHEHKAKSGLPIRGGLARALAWGYLFKNYAIKDWVIFLEGYGHPLRLGKYGPNETEGNKRILASALTQLGADAWGAIPETMSVEFIDRKAGTAPNDLWRSKAEFWDLQFSKAVLGQTMTTDAQAAGMGSGQANVQDGVRGDITDADAILSSATLTRDVVVPMIILNRGPRKKYPRLRIGRPDEVDAKVDIENASTLVAMGVKIGGNQMRERAGLPAPEEGEEPLVAAGVAAAVPMGADGEDGTTNPGAQVQQLALNGAQIKSLLEIVQAVEGGTMGEDAARAVIKTSFPAIGDTEIDELVAGAGKARQTPANSPGEGQGAPSGADPAKIPATDPLDPLKSPTAGIAEQVATAAAQERQEREPDGIDRAIDEALDDWQALVEPMRQPIDALLETAESLEDVRDGLINALQAMNVGQMQSVLARAGFGSRLLGDVEARGDGSEEADG